MLKLSATFLLHQTRSILTIQLQPQEEIMRKELFIVACSSFFLTSPTFANQCANTIINKTRVSLGSKTVFKNNVCTPYLLTLAKHPVRRHWPKMSFAEQSAQVDYACGLFYSVGKKIAKFDQSKIKWRGNMGTYTTVVTEKDGKLKTVSKVITLRFSSGCIATSACIDGICLQSIVTDYRKLN